MKKIMLSLCLVLTLILQIMPATYVEAEEISPFTAGSGTKESPYLLYTVEDLQLLSALVQAGNTFLNTYFQMQQHIDLSTVDDWEPIGQSGKNFSGYFDGNNKKITGFHVNKNRYYEGFLA